VFGEVAELPDIERLLRRYEGEGLVVLALNRGESFSRARDFMQSLGVDLTVVGLDPSQQVVGRYRVSAMPTSVFIDRQGVITRIHLGQATLGQMEDFVAEAVGSGRPSGN
jgi:hypothetical protein